MARAVEIAVVPAPEELVTLVDGEYVRVRERDVAALLEEALAHQCANRGFHDALAKQDLPAGVREQLRTRTLAILEPVVAAGRAGGALGPDVDAADLLVAIKMLGAASDEADAARYLDVVLRGLAPA